MRVDIDKQDILNALADTRKKFDRATAGLIVSLSVTAGLFIAAGFGLSRAISTILSAAPAPSLAGLRFAFETEPEPFYLAGGCLALAIIAVVTGLAILKARRKRAAARKAEALNHPLAAGRFEYIFSADRLTIMGPLSVKKIAWQNIAKLENRKSTIVFHLKDGGFEFIPKNVVPNDNFFDLMTVKHGPRINKSCSYEEANLAKPLKVTFEASRADYDDYYAHYFKKRDGKFHALRRLAQWRPWTPLLFFVMTMLAAFLGYAAFNTYSLIHAGAALACAGMAGAIFVMNGGYFRGAAHPFRKNAAWPYAQTDLATITLAKDGVLHTRHGATDFIRWAAVSNYMESKLSGFLVVAPKHAIPLPKRAFLSKAHFEDFTAFAKRSMSQAKQERAEAERGRLTRSFGNNTAAQKPASGRPAEQSNAQPKLPARAAQAPAAPAQITQIAEARAAKSAGPSPKAAPAQVKQAPGKPAQLKPAPKPEPEKRARQPQPAAVKKPPNDAPTPKPQAAKKPAAKPASETAAILNSALKKAAQLDAKARQKAKAEAAAAATEPPKKRINAAE